MSRTCDPLPLETSQCHPSEIERGGFFSFPPFGRKTHLDNNTNTGTCDHTRRQTKSLIQDITLERILTGQTKSPVGKADLVKWIEWKSSHPNIRQRQRGHVESNVEPCDAAAGAIGESLDVDMDMDMAKKVLEFLAAVEAYKALFASLPAEKAALSPPPFQVISQLSLQNPTIVKSKPVPVALHSSLSSSQGYEAHTRSLVGFTRSLQPQTRTTSPSLNLESRGVAAAALLSPPDTNTNTSRSSTVTGPAGHQASLISPTPTFTIALSGRPSYSYGAGTSLGRMISHTSSAGTNSTLPKSERNFRLPPSSAPLRQPARGVLDRPDSTASDDSLDTDSYLGPGLGVRQGPGARAGGPKRSISDSPWVRTDSGLKPVVERPLSHSPAAGIRSQPPESPRSSLTSNSNYGREGSTTPLLPDPRTLPLRTQLDHLIRRHLTASGSSRPSHPPALTTLFPGTLLTTLHSESSLSTHPEIFVPIAQSLDEQFTSTLNAFLEDSIRNLHRHTALGRLLVGVMCSLVAIGAELLLLLDPSPFRPDGPKIERVWRLLLVPVLLGGIGYGMGARAGMCFWLALFGVREEPYDHESSPTLSDALRALLHRSRTDQTHRQIRPQRKLRKRSASYQSDSLELFPSHLSRTRSGSNATTSSTYSRNQAERGEISTSTSTSILVLLWRLTGTAWGVKKVQDPILRRYQRTRAWKIAGWLTGVLLVVAVIMVLLPHIRLA